MKGKINVIVDVNLLVSATINRLSRERLKLLLFEKKITIWRCKELIDEYKAVLKREKFRKYVNESDVNIFLTVFKAKSKSAKIKSTIRNISRDPKDNYLLALSENTDSDYLITGDKDLLVLEKYKNTQILSLTDFFKKL